jgi:hypothetical protein
MTKAKLAWALAWREKVECNSTCSQAQRHDSSTEKLGERENIREGFFWFL